MSMHKPITFTGLLWFHRVPLSHLSNLYTWDNVLQYHHCEFKKHLSTTCSNGMKADTFWSFKIRMHQCSLSYYGHKLLNFHSFCLEGTIQLWKLSPDIQKWQQKKTGIPASYSAGRCWLLFQTLFLSKTDWTVSKQIIKWPTILWHCICLNQSAGCSSIHSDSDTAWWIIKHSSWIWPQGTRWYYASNTVILCHKMHVICLSYCH